VVLVNVSLCVDVVTVNVTALTAVTSLTVVRYTLMSSSRNGSFDARVDFSVLFSYVYIL